MLSVPAIVMVAICIHGVKAGKEKTLLTMAKNANLGDAKNEKNEEFYTQNADIQ